MTKHLVKHLQVYQTVNLSTIFNFISKQKKLNKTVHHVLQEGRVSDPWHVIIRNTHILFCISRPLASVYQVMLLSTSVVNRLTISLPR